DLARSSVARLGHASDHLGCRNPVALGRLAVVDGFSGREVKEVRVAHVSVERDWLSCAGFGSGAHPRDDCGSLLPRLALERANRLGPLVRSEVPGVFGYYRRGIKLEVNDQL